MFREKRSILWFKEYDAMDYKDCLQQIQKYLENSPLIVLGSGASADYGLPLMGTLSEEIQRHDDKFEPDEFTALCENLKTMNLEEAIDNTPLSDLSVDTLRKIVWECINEKDMALFQRLLQNNSDFALVKLLKKVIAPSQNSASIVTTNYDRLAEYAVDLMEAVAVTGFEGNLIQTLDIPSNQKRQQRIRIRERIVNIWKVHGSLDWFSNNGRSICLPLSRDIPLEHKPLIIPPGKGKYNITHNEPYRSIIAQADMAFSQANSFLCIGYGFNDEHIQPKLIEQIKKGKPIVVLCYTATDACRQNVVSDDVSKYAIIERSTDGKTLVTGKNYAETYNGDFWRLPDFIKTVRG